MTDQLKAPAIGAVVELDAGIDLTGNTGLSIEVKKPTGTTVSWSAQVGATNQLMEHTIQAGDLNEEGTYLLVSAVSFAGNLPLYGKDPATLHVLLDKFKR